MDSTDVVPTSDTVDQSHNRTQDSDALRLRVRQLERQLKATEDERNDLERDVEQLCMSRGSHMFSSSYVLSERLKFLENEVQQQRIQLRSVVAERDNLQEDIFQIQTIRKQLDKGWQADKQKLLALEQQLSFFKSSSATAIADRDSAIYEAQIFKAELDAAQVSLKECRARISSLQQQCQEQQQQLLSTHLDLEAARSELAMCRTELKQVPMLQQQLFDRQQRLQQLQADLVDAQSAHQASLAAAAAAQSQLAAAVSEADSLKGHVSHLRISAKAAAAQHREATAALQKKLTERSIALDDVQRMLEQTSAALVVTQAALKEDRAVNRAPELTASSSSSSRTSTQQQQQDSVDNKLAVVAASPSGSTDEGDDAGPREDVQKLKAELCDVEDHLQRAARSQVDVLHELAELQALRDEHEVTIQQLEETNNHLKVRLAQATEEKVQALMRLADLDTQTEAEGDEDEDVGEELSSMKDQQAAGQLEPVQSLLAQEQQQEQDQPIVGPCGGTTPGSPVAYDSSSSRCYVQPPSTPDRSAPIASSLQQRHQRESVAAAAAATQIQEGTSPGLVATVTATVINILGQQHQQQQQQQQEVTASTRSREVDDCDSRTAAAAAAVDSQSASPSPSRLNQDRELLLHQLHLRTHTLEQLLLFAHHCRTVLADLQPGAIIDAAAAGSSNNSSSSSGGGDPAIVKDPMAQLSELSQELQASRKLLCKNKSSQQQHEALVMSCASASNSSGYTPAKRAASILNAANNNLLNNTTTSSKHNAVSSKATTSSWAKLFGSSSISSSTITPDTVACGGLCSTALASDAVWAAQLDAAVATEVQLLADMCVLALQHVHKIAAVSAMLDDKW